HVGSLEDDEEGLVDVLVKLETSFGLFLSQKKYALQLLEHAHMVTCNPSRTPIDTESKLDLEGVPVQDPTLYRSLAEGSTLKRILRYVRGTVDFGLQLYVFATTSLVGFTDADWACFPSTQVSSGYCIFLGDNFFCLGHLNDIPLFLAPVPNNLAI
ncbi:ribonuclease H-like domain-containing protein, partial [Tanacetum coccineum]